MSLLYVGWLGLFWSCLVCKNVGDSMGDVGKTVNC